MLNNNITKFILENLDFTKLSYFALKCLEMWYRKNIDKIWTKNTVFFLAYLFYLLTFFFVYRIQKSGIMAESPGKFLQIPDYRTRHFVCILLPMKQNVILKQMEAISARSTLAEFGGEADILSFQYSHQSLSHLCCL